MQSAWEEDALNVLKDTGSLPLAIEKINSLTKQAERIEEVKKAQEEASKAELEAKRAEDKAVVEEPQELIESETDILFPFAAEKIVVLKVNVGENNLNLVKDFFESINIEYEVIE